METFLECMCETMCREPAPGHVFVESLAEIDGRKVAEVVHRTRHKKTTGLQPILQGVSGSCKPCISYDRDVCLSVRPSVRLSHAGTE